MTGIKKVDFSSGNEVRWCPGCGDYAILAAMQRYLAMTEFKPEQIVFVSGIGCAGRFPYYMNTYGFHAIHGRAPAIATGIKMMRPDLSVWLVTGDGDGLSIGASHLMHCLRRNLNINILLLNNQIYGLTKGQASPTSPLGQISKTTPQGTMVAPINAVKLALAAGATFVARGLDKDPKHLAELFKQAEQHQGTSFIEIYQNCPIFNDGAYQAYDNKRTRDQHVIYLEKDKPLNFASDCYLKRVNSDWHLSNNKTEATKHLLTNIEQANALSELPNNGLPLPLGVYYQTSAPLYSPLTKKVTATFEQLQTLL